MALNFPDSPTLNQIYTDTTSGFSYQWDGTVWQSYRSAASKNISILDDISGSFDGLTNSFPITINGSAFTPANAQQLRIVLGGIVQQPLADYVVSGTNIAFTTPPSSGLTFSGVSLGPALPAVGVGSTGTFYTRQSYNVSGTQSSFTVTGGYDIGFLDVYHNGVRLVVGIDYTASDGSGFTLTTPAQNTDIVEAISFVTSEYYTLNGIVNDLVVSGNASIGGNTYITGITTVLGSLNVIGGGNFSTAGIGTFGSLEVTNSTTSGNLNVTGVTTLGSLEVTNSTTSGNLNVTGITTLVGGNVKIGIGTTALIVEGNARITGILTIGTSSITLDGSNNQIKIGTAITFSENGETTFTSRPVLIGSATSTGTASQPLQVTGGAYVSGNVGIGITNPVRKLEVVSDTSSPFNGNAQIVVTNSSTSADTYTGIIFNATDSTSIPRHGASISMLKDGTWTGGSGSYPGHLVFATRPSSGDQVEAVRIISNGNVGINSTNPGSRLSVGGSITELSQGQYWNVVTQADVGIGASQVPLNQYLGQLAFLDEFGTNIPQNAQTAAYTLVREDSGKHISITTGGVTVPAGVFEIGDNIMIYNNSGSSQTITQGGSVTLRFAGSSSTGNRTLSQYGLATILCVASNTFVISGSGLS
jgi:hypothetical protein